MADFFLSFSFTTVVLSLRSCNRGKEIRVALYLILTDFASSTKRHELDFSRSDLKSERHIN